MRYILKTVSIILLTHTLLFAQGKNDPLNIFGYFQVSFMHFSEQDYNSNYPDITGSEWLPAQNTFSLQHLNIFLSKNISDHWRAFINFEFTNSFSSYKNWGAFNLEEVWIRYKPDDRFATQAGLLIPTFNNLNEIKNRTPLLPYIFRPFVYETSLKDFFDFIEDFVPSRAWLQVSGTFRHDDLKFDYALYTGNSPNISETGRFAPSGYDTTSTFLIGGRLGLRWQDLKLGISLSHDKKNLHMYNDFYSFDFNLMPRVRLGADLSFQTGILYFETEMISLSQDESHLTITQDDEKVTDAITEFSMDGRFFYSMVLLNATNQFKIYVSYSRGEMRHPYLINNFPRLILHENFGKLSIPTFGIAWHVNDNVILKAQYLKMNIEESVELLAPPALQVDQKRNMLMLAGSVFF